MIEEKTLGQQWQFVFLSADLNAIQDAVSTGIHRDAVLLFAKNARGTEEAWASLSKREQLKQVVTNRVSQFFTADSFKVEGDCLGVIGS